MTSHAGLHRVVKTVHGKKGSVQRAYWIASDPRAKQQAQSANVAANHGTHDGRALKLKRAALIAGMTVAGAFIGPRLTQVGTASILAAATALQHGASAHHMGRTQASHQITSAVVTFGDMDKNHRSSQHETFIAPAQNLSGSALRQNTMAAAKLGAARGMRQGLRAYGSPGMMAASRIGGAAAGAYIGNRIAQRAFRDTTPRSYSRSR